MGPAHAHTESAAAAAAAADHHRRRPALVAWLTPGDDGDDDLRRDPEARMLRASRPMPLDGEGGVAGAPPDAFMHERVWVEDYARALGASRHARRSGESVPGGPHGPVALNLLSRRLQLMATLAGVCSVALPAYAYATVYRSYDRLWPVSFSGKGTSVTSILHSIRFSFRWFHSVSFVPFRRFIRFIRSIRRFISFISFIPFIPLNARVKRRLTEVELCLYTRGMVCVPVHTETQSDKRWRDLF